MLLLLLPPQLVLLFLTCTERSGAEPQQSEQQFSQTHGPATPATIRNTVSSTSVSYSTRFLLRHTENDGDGEGSSLREGIVSLAANQPE